MYKIVGADQREYGPVSGDELRQWIVQGRANAQTLVLADGALEWRPLREFPEFAADLNQGFSNPSPPAFSPGPTVFANRELPVKNGMATAGLVCGILGFACCGCGPPFSLMGVIFSCVALSQLNSNPEQRGRGAAIVGLILSILGGLAALGLWSASFLTNTGGFRFFHF